MTPGAGCLILPQGWPACGHQAGADKDLVICTEHLEGTHLSPTRLQADPTDQVLYPTTSLQAPGCVNPKTTGQGEAKLSDEGSRIRVGPKALRI